jgi:hypothetical protein
MARKSTRSLILMSRPPPIAALKPVLPLVKSAVRNGRQLAGAQVMFFVLLR